jgi:predicted RNase H-like nuclease (RuvC/YqgF family)
MKKSPVIIGIDPGTTSAYAVLDTDANLIDKNSGKENNLSVIISSIMSKGLPIIIGTDKAKIPELIGQFAAKTGARVAYPKEDMRTEEKRRLISGYILKDSHEEDALASAIFAYNSFSSLIKKIKKFAEENKKEGILNDLFVYVIKEEIPIRDAVSLIEKEDEETEIVKKVLEERNFQKKDFLCLYSKLNQIEKENSILRKLKNELAESNKFLEIELNKLQKIKYKKEEIGYKKVNSLFKFKEQRLEDISSKLRQKEEEVNELKEKIPKYAHFISKISKDSLLLKKLKNLGLAEFEEKSKILNISKDDILLVDDPNICNNKVLQNLNEKISAIIFKTKPTKATISQLNFELIPAEGLHLDEFDNFALANKEEIEKMLEKKNILNKMISEYKESRNLG